jgi:hypothetical protein
MIDTPRKAVRFSQFLPPLSDRWTNCPNAKTREEAEAGLRTCAPFSGIVSARQVNAGDIVQAGAAPTV